MAHYVKCVGKRQDRKERCFLTPSHTYNCYMLYRTSQQQQPLLLRCGVYGTYTYIFLAVASRWHLDSPFKGRKTEERKTKIRKLRDVKSARNSVTSRVSRQPAPADSSQQRPRPRDASRSLLLLYGIVICWGVPYDLDFPNVVRKIIKITGKFESRRKTQHPTPSRWSEDKNDESQKQKGEVSFFFFFFF